MFNSAAQSSDNALGLVHRTAASRAAGCDAPTGHALVLMHRTNKMKETP